MENGGFLVVVVMFVNQNKNRLVVIIMEKQYVKDGRLPIEDLYSKFSLFVEDPYNIWNDKSQLITSNLEGFDKKFSLQCFYTKQKGKALWIFATFHGEEPAGTIAVANNVKNICKLAHKNFPIVLFPLCNPIGYYRDTRYPNESNKKDVKDHKGKAPNEADYLIPKDKDGKPKKNIPPTSFENKFINERILELYQDYPPIVVFDMKEFETEKF